jgi:hypothetical protein
MTGGAKNYIAFLDNLDGRQSMEIFVRKGNTANLQLLRHSFL